MNSLEWKAMISSACSAAALTGAQALVDDILKVIDRVKIDIGEFADLGLDVARDRDVHHEDRAMLALLERPFHGAFAQDG